LIAPAETPTGSALPISGKRRARPDSTPTWYAARAPPPVRTIARSAWLTLPRDIDRSRAPRARGFATFDVCTAAGPRERMLFCGCSTPGHEPGGAKGAGVCVFWESPRSCSRCRPLSLMAQDPLRSVEDVLAEIAPKLRGRLCKRFTSHGAVVSAGELTLIAYKKERLLEVWAPKRKGWSRSSVTRSCREWRARAEAQGRRRSGAGGRLSPDGSQPEQQVPPLDPRRLPERARPCLAERDQRESLGGDIFIHGDEVSRGCLAVGDAPHRGSCHAGRRHGGRELAHHHRAGSSPEAPSDRAAWIGELYDDLRRALEEVRGDD